MDFEEDIFEDFIIGLFSPLLGIALFPLLADDVVSERSEKDKDPKRTPLEGAGGD